MKSFSVIVEKKINRFNKSIFVEGDKIWIDNGGDNYWYTMTKTANA